MPSPISNNIKLSVSFYDNIAWEISTPQVKYPASFNTSVDNPLPHPISRSMTALSGNSSNSKARSVNYRYISFRRVLVAYF